MASTQLTRRKLLPPDSLRRRTPAEGIRRPPRCRLRQLGLTTGSGEQRWARAPSFRQERVKLGAELALEVRVEAADLPCELRDLRALRRPLHVASMTEGLHDGGCRPRLCEGRRAVVHLPRTVAVSQQELQPRRDRAVLLELPLPPPLAHRGAVPDEPARGGRHHAHGHEGVPNGARHEQSAHLVDPEGALLGQSDYGHLTAGPAFRGTTLQIPLGGGGERSRASPARRGGGSFGISA